MQVRRVVAALWAYVLCWVGVAFVWQSNDRTLGTNFTQTKAWGAHLDQAKPLLPWGVLFLAVGLVIAAGVVSNRPSIARPALGGAVLLAWVFSVGGSLAAAVLSNGSWSAVGFSQGIVGALTIATWRLSDSWGM